MSGFIPALKIDKIPLGEGLVIKGEVVGPDARVLNAFTDELHKFLANWRARATKGQVSIDFSSGLTLSGVTLRADKPKLSDKGYSIGIDMTGVSLDDRSKLFNYAHDDSKEIHLSITAVPKKAAKAKDAKDDKREEAKPREVTITEKDPGLSELQLVDHSAGELLLPEFPMNSVEERLQLSLFIKDADAAKRWAGRIETGLTDRNLKTALFSEWDGSSYEAPDEGLHFIVMAKGQTGPAFRLSEKLGMKVMINTKPTLSGVQLYKKVREVLGLPGPSKASSASHRIN